MRRVSVALVAVTVAAALIVLAIPAVAARGEPRSFNVTPATLKGGQTITSFGRGCLPGVGVRIRLDGRLIQRDVTDHNGRFVALVQIPAGTTPGPRDLTAGCGSRYLGGLVIRVLRSELDVSPRLVEAGDPVTGSGGGCPHGLTVHLKLNRTLVGTTRANRFGRFRKSVATPGGTPAGVHVVSARCAGRFVGAVRVQVTDPYPAAPDSLGVSASAAPAGETITVTGDRCPDSVPAAALDGQPLALSVDRGGGEGFSARATIPRGTPPGAHQLWAGCDAGSAGTTPLTVLDPAGSGPAAARQAFGTRHDSDQVIWGGLVAGVTLLVASLGVTRRRRT
jgi:hypothetical protein